MGHPRIAAFVALVAASLAHTLCIEVGALSSPAEGGMGVGERRLRRQNRRRMRILKEHDVRTLTTKVNSVSLESTSSSGLSDASHSLLEVRQIPMFSSDKCFQRYNIDCGECTRDPLCGMCTNERGVNKCMEGGPHGPHKCHLEDCRSWVYTSCQSVGITPDTCHEAPRRPPAQPAPPKNPDVLNPVKIVDAALPKPVPKEPSIIPGLAREERIEQTKLEEEQKHPESIVVAEHMSDYDKRQKVLEGMLSTQPIRDEIERDASTQEKLHGSLFVKAWQRDRKIKLEELIKTQMRVDRERVEEMYSRGATGGILPRWNLAALQLYLVLELWDLLSLKALSKPGLLELSL